VSRFVFRVLPIAPPAGGLTQWVNEMRGTRIIHSEDPLRFRALPCHGSIVDYAVNLIWILELMWPLVKSAEIYDLRS
jgi:hypothetical protein